MPKRTREHDIDTDTLEDISVLFIPFDAAGKFYKANVTKGVIGFKGFLDDTGQRREDTSQKKNLVLSLPKGSFLSRDELAAKLPDIVKQECELIRNIYNPDKDYDDIFDELVKTQLLGKRSKTWLERIRSTLERNLRGYKHYPDIIFLSENPTGKDFPDTIDTGIPGKGYVKKAALNGSTIKNIKRVNEMAVYLREDLDKRIEDGKSREDGLFLRAEAVTRKTTGLPKGTKDEYILKVTIGRKVGFSCTVAGVHLRAGLTSSNPSDRKKERAALKSFCDSNGIQLMVGDFNMDLQESTEGSRGVYFSLDPESQPRFSIGQTSTVAFPEYVQQYSNSSGTAHYMGFLQADTDTLHLEGTSVYGHQGTSGSRSLQGGGKYYSDHPSVYVRVSSERLTKEASDAILRRKIFRVVRSGKTG